MGAQRHVNRHAGAHIVTQHFDDFTDRFSASGRALGQLHDHYEAHSRAHHLFRWDQDVKAQTAVVRYDKAHAGIGEIATDNLAGFWHQNAHDARFAAAFTVRAQRLREDLIAMDAHFHLLGREIKVIFTPFDPQEAIAVAVADNGAFEQVETLRQCVALAAGKDQLPVTLHGAQAASQPLELFFSFDIQFCRQLVATGRFFTFC